MNQTLT